MIKKAKTSGAVRIEEKIRKDPGGVQYVERIIYRDPVVYIEEKESTSDSEVKREEKPSCPTLRKDRFLLGAGASEFRSGRPVDSLILGYSFRNRLDLSYQLGLDSGPRRHGLLAVVRF